MKGLTRGTTATGPVETRYVTSAEEDSCGSSESPDRSTVCRNNQKIKEGGTLWRVPKSRPLRP